MGGERKKEREREGKGERNTDVLYPFMSSLVESWILPDRGLNLQPWHSFKKCSLWWRESTIIIFEGTCTLKKIELYTLLL